jgi:ketosteroid isomerase-like protein
MEAAMSTERNEALVRRYFSQCVSGVTGPDRDGALSHVDELMSDDFVMAYSYETPGEAGLGRERHKEFLLGHAEAFPEDHWTVEALVADEAMVACEWRFRGRHAESGNQIDVLAADFFSVRDGRLTELRRFMDFADFRAQLKGRSNRR